MNCTVAISADTKEELVDAAVQHAVAVHGRQDCPQLREELAKIVKAQSPAPGGRLRILDHADDGRSPMTAACNAVRFRVKPERDQDFLNAHDKIGATWPGLLHANIISLATALPRHR